jgi:ubiquinone/menaquinone biosynthesis C-methylase UbiE
MDIRQAHNEAKYDMTASVYDIVAWIISLGQSRRLYGEVAKAIDVPPGGRIVELGCGPGCVTPYLLEVSGRDTTIIGIDFSRKMIAQAQGKKERYGWDNVAYIRQNMYDFKPQEPLDCVIFCLALTAIPEYQKAIDKALGMLKPGGELLILDSFPLAGKWSHCLSNLYIQFKALIVGAKPIKGIPEYIGTKMTILSNKTYAGGVYTLLKAKKP